MNPNQRWILFTQGPYALFCTLFSFILPPIGFLMAFHGYRKDKAMGERYFGWIVLMTISVLSSIAMIVLIIMIANMPHE